MIMIRYSSMGEEEEIFIEITVVEMQERYYKQQNTGNKSRYCESRHMSNFLDKMIMICETVKQSFKE